MLPTNVLCNSIEYSFVLLKLHYATVHINRSLLSAFNASHFK